MPINNKTDRYLSRAPRGCRDPSRAPTEGPTSQRQVLCGPRQPPPPPPPASALTQAVGSSSQMNHSRVGTLSYFHLSCCHRGISFYTFQTNDLVPKKKRYTAKIRGWGRRRNLADIRESAEPQAEKNYAVTFTLFPGPYDSEAFLTICSTRA